MLLLGYVFVGFDPPSGFVGLARDGISAHLDLRKRSPTEGGNTANILLRCVRAPFWLPLYRYLVVSRSTLLSLPWPRFALHEPHQLAGRTAEMT